MTHVLTGAEPAEAARIARVHYDCWLETYPEPAAGIDLDWLRAQRAELLAEAGRQRWLGLLESARTDPAGWFCRVVRPEPGGEVLGFLCGAVGERLSLGPMYLLRRAQGRGTGDRLMAEFLDWAAGRPIALWVTEYNSRAIRFYERHGFAPTGERELWRDRLPNVRMVRPGG
ncbi:GNAT family N-acetyltransferase [Kitasatospora sp. NPDC058965]|uniref:GNAT family N-acetyltransferase n=1 Tax=Kitasatospora sp. NPDC058965 TaxID=3346682 RepID=UPI0036BEBADB